MFPQAMSPQWVALMRYRVLAIYTNYLLGGNLVHKQINCAQIKGVQKLHCLKSQPVFSEASQMEWWEPLPWRGGRGGEDSAYEMGGDGRREFEFNPQRRPIWAWPNLFLTPKSDHIKLRLHKSSK